MKTPFEYRAQAREALQNRWGEAALIYVVILVLAITVSLPSAFADKMAVASSLFSSFGTTLLAILIMPLQYSFFISLLHRTRGSEETLWNSTWQLTKCHYTRLLQASLLSTVIISILSVFTLGIAGIIFSYAYRMVPYLMSDYPELSAREALKISREMMKGKKWELFVLDFSFIGWMLVALLTCGVGILFVTPYMQTATALFYEDLKAATIVEENDAVEETDAVEA